EAQAIGHVFQSIHRNDPDPKLLAYQYLQTLPQLAQGAGNTFWVIPSEVTTALKAVTSAFGGTRDEGAETAGPATVEPGAAVGADRAAVGPAGAADAGAVGAGETTAAVAEAENAAATALAAAGIAVPGQLSAGNGVASP